MLRKGAHRGGVPGTWNAIFPPRASGPPARRRSGRVLTTALLAGLAFLLLAGPASAASLFADGFESGDFSAWSQVQTAVGGTAVVQSAVARTGTLAAQLSETATSGSKAYVRKTLSASQQDITVSGDFQVSSAPTSGGNIPFFRLLDPSGARVVSIYRQNGSAGTIGLGYQGANFTSTGKLALGAWATVSIHVVTNGTSSTVEARLNGTLVYTTTAASLGTAGVQAIQIGNDTSAQAFGLYADTIAVDGVGDTTPSAPANVTLPTVSGTPQAGQTVTASTGTWTGSQPITYAYQWLRCDAASAACLAISGATSASYAVTAADVGDTLRVAVTASNGVGPSTATSNATAVVQGASTAPANTVAPTITGSAQAGQVLTAVPGTWTGTQPIAYAYAWRRCDSGGAICAPISGATGSSYTVATADVGSTLRVVVTASNAAGSGTATSAATAQVDRDADPARARGAVAHGRDLGHVDVRRRRRPHRDAALGQRSGSPASLGTAFGFTGSSYVSVPVAGRPQPRQRELTVTIRSRRPRRPPTPDWDLIRKGLYTTAGGEYKMEYQPSGQASCGFKGSSGYNELIAGPGDQQRPVAHRAVRQDLLGHQGRRRRAAFSKSAALGAIANTDACRSAPGPARSSSRARSTRLASRSASGRARTSRLRGRSAAPPPPGSWPHPLLPSPRVQPMSSPTDLPLRDGPRDECGVFGIYAPEHDVSRLAYFALYALQHRGQESAGIAAADRGGHIITQRALGLVNQVFKEHDLRALAGDLAIGHVRYSTTGSNEWENSQPVHRSAGSGGNRRELALAHNGNLINAVELHAELRERGRARSARRRTPRSSRRCSPRTRPTTLEDAIADVVPRLQGAFSTVVMTKDRVVAFRDPAGAAAARRSASSATATASRRSPARSTSSAPSTCATSRRARSSRSVRDGHRARARSSSGAREAFCVFEYIYFARPDSRMGGQLAAGRARPHGRDPGPRGAGAGRRPRHRRARLGQPGRARLRPRRGPAAGRRPRQEPLRRADVHPARPGAAQARPADEVQPAARDRRRQAARRRRRLDRARQHDAPDRPDAARRRRAARSTCGSPRRRSSTRATTASTCPRARR